MKRTLLATSLLSGLYLMGCGSQGGGTSGEAFLGSNPLVTQDPVNNPAQLSTPDRLEDISLRVVLELDGQPPEGLAAFPEQAERFRLEVFDGSSGVSLTAPILVLRDGQTNLTRDILGLSGNFLRVVITAEDEDGNFLGSTEQTLVATSQNLQALFSGLFLPGPTREVGRISNSSDTLGFSTQPALSRDGRFVAFVSTANDLIPGIVNLGRLPTVYLRDRQTGTTSQLSGAGLALQTATDGSSNTIVANEDGSVTFVGNQLDNQGVGGGGSRPAISANGEVVAFAFDRNGSQILLREGFNSRFPQSITPTSAPVGVQNLLIEKGFNPSVSGDGRFVAYVASSSTRPTQIALFDRQSRTTIVVSKNAGGQLANGSCANPVLSPDGKQIFFSTEATNLSGGQGGLMVHNLETEVTTTLASPSVHRCSVSDDLRFVVVNIDGRLRLLDRQLNSNEELPGLTNFVIQGAPSMSGDARYITFYSNRSDLVSNDANSAIDVFCIDRTTSLISRVNIAGDGTAVQGGVEQVLSVGPVISGDGNRIAYSSSDPLLVPNDNNSNADVFSSATPTGGILYSLAPNGRIYRYDNVSAASGPIAPSREFSSPFIGTAPPDLFLDTFNDRLYVAAGDGQNSVRLSVFERISTRPDGDIIPSRVRVYPNNQRGLFVDVGADLLYRGGSLFRSASRLGSTFPVRSLPVNPSSILLDTRRQILFVAQSNRVDLFAAGLGGLVQPTFSAPMNANLPVSLQFDISPSGFTFRNNANLMMFSQGPFITTGGETNFNRILRFPSVLSAGNNIPNRNISGTNTGLGQAAAELPGPFLIDSYTGQGYANNGTDNNLRVFGGVTQDTGDIAPTRVIQLQQRPRAMVLDRTR